MMWHWQSCQIWVMWSRVSVLAWWKLLGFAFAAQNHVCICLCDYSCMFLINLQPVSALSPCSVLLSVNIPNLCPTLILTGRFSSGIVVFCPTDSQHDIFLHKHSISFSHPLSPLLSLLMNDFHILGSLQVQFLEIFSKCLRGWKKNNKLFSYLYFSL